MSLLVRSNRTFMELKYHQSNFYLTQEQSSNRTFMELKSYRENYTFNRAKVLIVPLWN